MVWGREGLEHHLQNPSRYSFSKAVIFIFRRSSFVLDGRPARRDFFSASYSSSYWWTYLDAWSATAHPVLVGKMQHSLMNLGLDDLELKRLVSQLADSVAEESDTADFYMSAKLCRRRVTTGIRTERLVMFPLR